MSTFRKFSKKTDRAHRVGVDTEDRFFRIMSLWTKERPEWCLRTFRASEKLDKKGIDFLVEVLDEDNYLRHIPIQIKSSDFGRREFLKKHDHCYNNHVRCVVVAPYMTDAEIRGYMFHFLIAARTEAKARHEFLHTLIRVKGR